MIIVKNFPSSGPLKMKVYLVTVVLAILTYKLYPTAAYCSCKCCKQRIDQLEKTLLDAINKGGGQKPKPPAKSCAEIKRNNPNSKSGLYTIVDVQGRKQSVFCFMGSLPGCGAGGWRRIASLDRTKGDQCPSALLSSNLNGRPVCRRRTSKCDSVFFPTGQKYTRVCGQVRGYRTGSPDSFTRYGAGSIFNINTPYLDGVSITYGTNPYRKHIWSYATTHNSPTDLTIICPCTGRNNRRPNVPPFVGNNYYCEGGAGGILDNILWDGKRCTSSENRGCCNRPNGPWFHRRIGITNSAVELRLCADEGPHNEQIHIFKYELYIQ